ncbi:response regulator [Echinicola strongylocentroti]|nr:hypothetical protein [Echinicola strongylocentroti]
MAKIIIVEKDIDLADNICEMLKYGNFHPVAISSISDGFDLPNTKPSLFIIGIDDEVDKAYVDRINNLCQKFNCPIIFLSPGIQHGCTKESCQCISKTAIIDKPFTFRSLHTAVHKLLNEQRTKTNMCIN